MLTDEPEEMEKEGIVDRDFAQSDVEASGSGAGQQYRKQVARDNDLSMKRTVSFHPGETPKTKRVKRMARRRASTIDSISTLDTEDDSDHDDSDEDDEDGTSTIMTDTTDISEDDPDDDNYHQVKRSKYTPSFVSRHREKRKRRRAKAKREHEAGYSGKVYRRTPVLSGVIAPFSIMLEVRFDRCLPIPPGLGFALQTICFSNRFLDSRVDGTSAQIPSPKCKYIEPIPSFLTWDWRCHSYVLSLPTLPFLDVLPNEFLLASAFNLRTQILHFLGMLMSNVSCFTQGHPHCHILFDLS